MSEPQLSRILMTADTVGGVWTFVLELAEALAGHGIEVVLATMAGQPSEAQRVQAAMIPGLSLFTSNFKLEWMDDPQRDVQESGRWLLDLEEQYKPDLVHLNSYGHGALGWRRPVILTAHSCVLSWWEAVRREPLPAHWNWYREVVTQAIHAVDILVAPSRAMLRGIELHYGRVLPNNRMVVANGRCAHRFRAVPKEPFVLTSGRLWDEAKNASAIARIAARLPWPVYMAGEERLSGALPARFDGCRMLGRLGPTELAAWFGRTSIYALPARYEPFGLSALEAALSGCALVVGDIPSLREVWEDAAIFVPPDDSDRLESVLRELIADQELRERMARRAESRARVFNPERMARGYLEAYRTAIANRRELCVS